jgi:hypothetical protein
MRIPFCHFQIFAPLCAVAVALIGTSQPCSAQTVAEQTGLAQLQSELGAALEDGSGVSAAIIEAFVGGPGAYLPNPTGVLAGKTFNDRGAPPEDEAATTSGHSSNSANRLLGPSSSAPGLNEADVFSTTHWLTGGGLRFGTNRAPLSQPYKVSNHSYILQNGTNFGQAEAANILARLDYYADQNDTVVVVGTRNSTGALPLGLTGAYNAISVGLTNGRHGSNPTVFYGPGRTKVDIVAPLGNSSSATPAVASAAVLLASAADSSDAERLEVIKATLLAGATKDEFADWDRTTTRPLDEIYGAGELNVYNSYQIQAGGQFNGNSSAGGAAVGHDGWDYENSLGRQAERFYRFEVQEDEYLNELSIVLSWNFEGGSSFFGRFSESPISSLANLDLELTDANGAVVDSSVSTVDNTEHLHLTDLAPGTYDLKVSTDAASSFGLAWRFDGSALVGDFNFDQVVDFDDTDFYTGNLDSDAVGDLELLDLDGDQMITQADLEQHVTTLVQDTGVPFADFNLDGVVDVLGDGVILLLNLDGEGPLGYADGDLNGNGMVDVLTDGVRFILELDGATAPASAGIQATAVPEPATGLLSLVATTGYLLRRRRTIR